jgi:hypothetical protein
LRRIVNTAMDRLGDVGIRIQRIERAPVLHREQGEVAQQHRRRNNNGRDRALLHLGPLQSTLARSTRERPLSPGTERIITVFIMRIRRVRET